MPTYDYVCGACGHQLEAFQRFSEDPLQDCPACGEAQLTRQFGTGGGILFKGSGFYETDYRSESYRSAASADQKSANGAASDSSSTADTSSSASSSTGNASS
jgi:putative FmdB family regulatory protein